MRWSMIEFPDNIIKLIGNERFSYNNVGMSDSTVIVFTDKILKVQTISEESEREYQIMEWLQDKLPVPKVLAYEKDEEKNYLLMTKVPGEMSCVDKYMKNPEKLVTLLAGGLKQLWSVDISDCKFKHGLREKLRKAEYNVHNNLIGMEDIETETFGEYDFESPKEILNWLVSNMPVEEPVLSHGDYCLPNIFLSGEDISGYIDLGQAGIADRWQDIALCYRSLIDNYEGKFCRMKYKGFRPDYLFEKLGIAPDWNKIHYYILLDELL